jgi:hypothetical protein
MDEQFGMAILGTVVMRMVFPAFGLLAPRSASSTESG